jgi:hypothetical protein
MIPPNGASMADAANTRENEGESCCDDCDKTPESCGQEWEDCQQEFEEAAADDDVKASKEDRDDN